MTIADGRQELERYARDTWVSLEQLVVPQSGLPADAIDGRLSPGSRSRHTSPTNIAMWLWALLAARDLGFITQLEAHVRLERALASTERLPRHRPSGQLYNWYDPVSLARLEAWPEPPGHRVYPFVSSVDNGWLASALWMLESAAPPLGERARALLSGMRFDAYHDPLARGAGPGLLRGGFWCPADAPPGSERLPRGDYAATGEEVLYTGHHYGLLNTEARIASYVGIALGQLPPAHYFALSRGSPETSAPGAGRARRYLGVDVFEGVIACAGARFLPTWGGSMFEALMPTLVIPELRWGARSWGVTHPLYVRAQIELGRKETRSAYWGFSPSSDPAGGYGEYGVPALGTPPHAYATSSGAGPVVTPHAVFLALGVCEQAALESLAALRRGFPSLYGPGGFKDAVDVATGRIADRYLTLDQGMALASAAGVLLDGGLTRYLAPALEPSLAPLLELEEFAAAPA